MSASTTEIESTKDKFKKSWYVSAGLVTLYIVASVLDLFFLVPYALFLTLMILMFLSLTISALLLWKFWDMKKKEEFNGKDVVVVEESE